MWKRSIPWLRWLSLLGMAVVLLPGAGARVLRVRWNAPGAAHDGATWDTAYLAVTQALAAAAASDQVWVAAGTYKERITIKSGVALYGGFAGNEAALDGRDVLGHPTVLDGEKKGCVVTFETGAPAATRLDGFSVVNGTGINGAGIVSVAGNPVIANNSIVGNISTGWAGGLEVFGGSPTVAGNLFMGNFASGVYGDGGAIHVTRGGAPVIAGNTFRGNIASQNGGGIAIFHSSPTILANTFRGNISFVLSIASSGGYSSRAAIGGGAVFGTATDEDYKPVLYAKCEPVIASNVVAGNGGDYATGGICLIDAIGSSALVANNTIVSNNGAGLGWASTAPRFVNNIVAYNMSGLYHMSKSASTATLRNNCVFHNGTMFVRADYLNVPDATGANGNLAADPRLASPAWGNAHIQPNSPCLGAGDPTVIGKNWIDVDGGARLVGAVDIGADESDGTLWNPAPVVVRVAPEGNDANDGSTWALAKKSIQKAEEAASILGGEVWVKAGTYNERFFLRPYAYLYGGFKGNEASRDLRDPRANVTTLDGGRAGTVVIIEGGYQVSRLDGFVVQNGRSSDDGGGVWVNVGSPLIVGNTIADNSAVNDGGGMVLYSAHPILYGNTIVRNRTENSISGMGGGLCCTFSSPVLLYNDIGENKGMSGTGINIDYNDINPYGGFFGPVLLGNSIYRNTSAGFLSANEGGLRLVSSKVNVLGNLFADNVLAQSGGGISMSDTSGRIANNVFFRNKATMNGGAIIVSVARGALSIENNTFVFNECAGDSFHEWGGAMCTNNLYADSPAIRITNNIFAYNTSGIFHNEYTPGPPPAFRNNCVWSNVGGGLDYDYMGCPDPTGQNGNIRADPTFVSLNPLDLHLAAGSPGIDTGDDSVVCIGDADWYGRPRLLGDHVDMGAVEAGSIAPYTLQDVRRALRLIGGIDAVTQADLFRLNIAPAWFATAGLDMADAAALARRAAGLD